MLYGPKFIYAIPLLVLAPAVAVKCRRHLLVLLAGLALVVVPIMGFRLSWGWMAASPQSWLRVITCNLHGDLVDSRLVMRMLEDVRPDVVAFQECPAGDRLQLPPGWNVQRHGSMMIASHLPIEEHQVPEPKPAGQPRVVLNVMRVVLQTDQGTLGIFSVHLRTPRHGLEGLYDPSAKMHIGMKGVTPLEVEIQRRRLETAAVRDWIDSFDGPSIVAGDFNMPVQSTIYRRTWRDRTNAFSAAGFGFGYTKRTPIQALEGLDYGVRIDHILADPGVKILRCWVGPDVGSDHLPVCADVGLADQPQRRDTKRNTRDGSARQ